MSPERVVVKGFGGIAYVRWLIGVLPNVAKITNDAGVAAIQHGQEPEFVVGFPLADVFSLPIDKSILEGETQDWAIFRPKFE